MSVNFVFLTIYTCLSPFFYISVGPNKMIAYYFVSNSTYQMRQIDLMRFIDKEIASNSLGKAQYFCCALFNFTEKIKLVCLYCFAFDVELFQLNLKKH